MKRAALGALAALMLAAPAHGALVQAVPGPQSGTNGIAVGPDGNLWVAERASDSVLRMTPGGKVLAHYEVGSGPVSVLSAAGKVWVSVQGADKLVWFDAGSPTPTTHELATGDVSECGPVGLAAGPGVIFFSLPQDGSCPDASMIGRAL